MEKHFEITVTDGAITWSRRQERIDAEARLDGVYVIRTSLDAEAIGPEAAVEAYKSLAQVERAFRILKASRLKFRPVHVYSEDHVRAHVFLCVLAFYVEWHLRRRLAPLLFEDDDREGARAQRTSPVAPAKVSESAKLKADTKLTSDGLPVHSLNDASRRSGHAEFERGDGSIQIPTTIFRCLRSRRRCRAGLQTSGDRTRQIPLVTRPVGAVTCRVPPEISYLADD